MADKRRVNAMDMLFDAKTLHVAVTERTFTTVGEDPSSSTPPQLSPQRQESSASSASVVFLGEGKAGASGDGPLSFSSPFESNTTTPHKENAVQEGTTTAFCTLPGAVMLKYFSLFALVLQTTAAVVLTRYANVKRPPGVPPFAPTSLVTMQEILKLFFSLLLVVVLDYDSHADWQRRWRVSQLPWIHGWRAMWGAAGISSTLTDSLSTIGMGNGAAPSSQRSNVGSSESHSSGGSANNNNNESSKKVHWALSSGNPDMNSHQMQLEDANRGGTGAWVQAVASPQSTSSFVAGNRSQCGSHQVLDEGNEASRVLTAMRTGTGYSNAGTEMAEMPVAPSAPQGQRAPNPHSFLCHLSERRHGGANAGGASATSQEGYALPTTGTSFPSAALSLSPKYKHMTQDPPVQSMHVHLPITKECLVRLQFLRESLYKHNLVHIWGTLKISVPALLYTVQNNVIYIALENLDATVFQVGYQSKVVMTGVLTVWMIPNRHLSLVKWLALALLTAGIVIAQIGESMSSGSSKPISTKPPSEATNSHILGALVAVSGDSANSINMERKSATYTTWSPLANPGIDISVKQSDAVVGFLAVLMAACCSGFAGVYFERVLKTEQRTSVWMRNAQLAFFSSIIAVNGYWSSAHCRSGNGFFDGYYGLIWIIILTQTGGGLIIAMVIKYADNILKCFATAISIIVCGVLSSISMGFSPSLVFCYGSLIVIVATFMYSK